VLGNDAFYPFENKKEFEIYQTLSEYRFYIRKEILMNNKHPDIHIHTQICLNACNIVYGNPDHW
jgi:hypothetical protein